MMMSEKRYILQLFILLVVALSCVGAFNYVVNPYLVLRDMRISGFNAVKADINGYVRQGKAYQPLSLPIDTLLVGNSRVEMGLDPSHPCLGGSAYNLGLPGAGIELQVAYAMNLLAQKPIKRVLMSLDFVDFLHVGQPTTGFHFIGQERLAYRIDGKPNRDYIWYRWQDYYLATLSLDALVSSVKTVLGQHAKASDRSPMGFNPARDLAAATRMEGPYRVFQQKRRAMDAKYIGKTWVYQTQAAGNMNFPALARLIEKTAASKAQLAFFISPLHQSFFTSLEAYGLSDEYQLWRRDVMSFLRAQRVPLHDYAQISGITDEPLPQQNQRVGLRWFWEPAHYKSRLGNRLLREMLGDHCSG